MNESDLEAVRGSGNAFADFGHSNAEVEQLKAILAARIIRVLDTRGLTVRAAEQLTGTAAADFSRIRRVKLDRFTIDRLMMVLSRLDQTIEFDLRFEEGNRDQQPARNDSMEISPSTAASQSEERYELRSPFLSPVYHLPIDKVRFEATKTAKDFLLAYMALEESVLQVLYAQQLFEEYLLKGALDYYLFSTHDYQYFQQMRLRANIHVGGVLNSITSFRDQFPKFTGQASELRGIAKKRWDELKATSIPFAFGERLRNYAQHQSQPVSSATTGGGWDDDRTLLESHLSVFCDVSAVTSNRDVSASEKKRYIDTFGESADLALVLREMVGNVGTVVREARAHLAAPYSSAVEQYEETLALAAPYFEGAHTTDLVHLRDESLQERHGIFEEFTQRAKHLRSNMVMTNNHMHYVSNRARGHGSATKKTHRANAIRKVGNQAIKRKN